MKQIPAFLMATAAPLLLTACDDGVCAFKPELCELSGRLTLTQSKLSWQPNGALDATKLSVSVEGTWPDFREGLKGKLTLTGDDPNSNPILLDQATANLSNAIYAPGIAPLTQRLTEGQSYNFTLRMYHHDKLLTTQPNPTWPTLTVMGSPVQPKLEWTSDSANPLMVMAPPEAATTDPGLLVRGLWVGRGAAASRAELLLLRKFNKQLGGTAAKVSGLGGPSMTWVSTTANGDNSFFDLWRFGSSAEVPRAVYLAQNAPDYFIFQGVLKDPDGMYDQRGTLTPGMTTKYTAMALAARPGSTTLAMLLQLDTNKLQAVVSIPLGANTLVDLSAGPQPALLAGYADKADGSGSVGFLGLSSVGEPMLFDFDGTTVTYNASRSTSLKTSLGMEAATALAVGDVTGDGSNDIVIARGGKVSFYVQTAGNFVRMMPDLQLPAGVSAAAIAVGPIDGPGKNDLVVADSQQRACGSACTHLYVYLNQTP